MSLSNADYRLFLPLGLMKSSNNSSGTMWIKIADVAATFGEARVEGFLSWLYEGPVKGVSKELQNERVNSNYINLLIKYAFSL